MSKQRFVLLAFFIASLLVGLTMDAALGSMFAQFGMPDNRVAGLLATSTSIGVVSGFLTFVILLRTPAAVRFSGEVVSELLRVTWPKRDEAVRAATTVVATTLFTAAVLALYDLTWKNLADLVLFTER